QNDKISCPTNVMKGAEFRLVGVGTRRLFGNRSQFLEQETLGQQLADEFILGDPSDENLQFGNRAIVEYMKELKENPNDLGAIDNLATLLFQMAAQPFDMAKAEQAKSYFQEHIRLEPQNPEPYVWVGAIDWILEVRANDDLSDTDNLGDFGKAIRDVGTIPTSVRAEYVHRYGVIADEGINDLQKAIAIDPFDQDAVLYLQQLYRIKADLVETPTERSNLIAQANDVIPNANKQRQSIGSRGYRPHFNPAPSVNSITYWLPVHATTPSAPPMPEGTSGTAPPMMQPLLSLILFLNPDVGPYPNAGTSGYGSPACLYCPQPQFTKEAADAKYQGTVLLIAIITADGRAVDIRIARGLGLGLTEKAVEAVSTWRFRPALGPDGKPAAVRQSIEVTFRRY
ncbi:MAG: energy transducer TonB, partial [Candidatus Acidiferrales bacterium]